MYISSDCRKKVRHLNLLPNFLEFTYLYNREQLVGISPNL